MIKVLMTELLYAVSSKINGKEPDMHYNTAKHCFESSFTNDPILELPDAEMCGIDLLKESFAEDQENAGLREAMLNELHETESFDHVLFQRNLFTAWQDYYDDTILHVAIDWANANQIYVIDDREKPFPTRRSA